MFKSYLSVAWRNLLRRKVFTALNIVCLTVGMSLFFLIMSFVHFELSYDSMHTKASRIFRVVTDVETPSETLKYHGAPLPAAHYLKKDFPEVESFARVRLGDNWMVIHGTDVFEEPNVAIADSTFFKVFDFPLLKGNPSTALTDPYSIVINQTIAKQLFGDADPIGQSLSLTRERFQGIVTAVMEDLPENTRLKINMIMSNSTVYLKQDTGFNRRWEDLEYDTYLLLAQNASPKNLEAKMPAFLQKYDGPGMIDRKMKATMHLEPLRDIYLRSTRDGNPSGNISNVYIFSVVGVFILLIACVNFVNLATARSTERAKEVGIRKVSGATKRELAFQFIGESVLICIISYCLAMICVVWWEPLFERVIGKSFHTGITNNFTFYAELGIFSVILGILAGIYPALVLTSFNPVAVLKGRFSSGSRGLLLRKTLIIVQFAMATGLIVGTMIIYHQLHFMKTKDLGFNKTQELILNTRGDSARQILNDQLKALPGVQSTAMSSTVPGEDLFTDNVEMENVKGVMQTENIASAVVDYDYLSHFGIKIEAGRSFSRQFGTDSTQALIVNEAAVRELGYQKAAQIIGKHYSQWGNSGIVVGVVKDFHARGLQEVIKPFCFQLRPRLCALISVRLSGQSLAESLQSIQQLWKKTVPDRPFTYYFLDERFDRQYRQEQHFGETFFSLAAVAIVLSCLGLLGLVSFSLVQRRKEIGIRKVIGATVAAIVMLVYRDFAKLIFIAFFIAMPLSWWFAGRWQQGFAYQAGIAWWIFGLAGIAVLGITALTISFQAIRAALSNPLKSLRSE